MADEKDQGGPRLQLMPEWACLAIEAYNFRQDGRMREWESRLHECPGVMYASHLSRSAWEAVIDFHRRADAAYVAAGDLSDEATTSTRARIYARAQEIAQARGETILPISENGYPSWNGPFYEDGRLWRCREDYAKAQKSLPA